MSDKVKIVLWGFLSGVFIGFVLLGASAKEFRSALLISVWSGVLVAFLCMFF
jgi:hypothetical protein